jgi:hypothetical protein
MSYCRRGQIAMAVRAAMADRAADISTHKAYLRS